MSPSAFPLPTFRAQLQASLLPGTQVYQLEVISLLLMITVLGKPKILSMKLVFCIWIPLGEKSYKFFPLLVLFKVSFSLGISSECLIYGSPDKGWSPKSSFFKKTFLAIPWSMQDLSSRPGIEPTPPALEVWSLNRQSSRQVPECYKSWFWVLAGPLSLWLQLLFPCVLYWGPWHRGMERPTQLQKFSHALTACKFLAPGGYWLIVRPAQAALALSYCVSKWQWLHSSSSRALCASSSFSWECLGPWLSASVRRGCVTFTWSQCDQLHYLLSHCPLSST